MIRKNMQLLAISIFAFSAAYADDAKSSSCAQQPLDAFADAVKKVCEVTKDIISDIAVPVAKSGSDHELAAAFVKLCQDYKGEATTEEIRNAAEQALTYCKCYQRRPDLDYEGLQHCRSSIRNIEKLMLKK